jgi:hypothetical protein
MCPAKAGRIPNRTDLEKLSAKLARRLRRLLLTRRNSAIMPFACYPTCRNWLQVI